MFVCVCAHFDDVTTLLQFSAYQNLEAVAVAAAVLLLRSSFCLLPAILARFISLPSDGAEACTPLSGK